ncbi:CRISPR-associated endonuclease Cas3'' [Lignipirellula cremea]|uniref:HD Cas3-type domain-containing protein n=1 Tax=Lignipirellula cremea TaxID=2528010 RepID=A0A518E410_9BACT|nr:CRISPR-associated endonuclease Cas3'' [Lignipirellula cremea]QDU98829.1 hypothetical protein Pla8534_67400 [Lignipirellula cremea]
MSHYAHSLPEDSDKSNWETLPQHEIRVAARCREFLGRIDAALEAWGEPLGKWHDLGKYQPDFQAKLTGEAIQIEHAGVGAQWASRGAWRRTGIPVQFAIAGHHTGLANAQANPLPNDRDYGTISRLTLLERLQNNTAAADLVSRIASPETLQVTEPELPGW